MLHREIKPVPIVTMESIIKALSRPYYYKNESEYFRCISALYPVLKEREEVALQDLAFKNLKSQYKSAGTSSIAYMCVSVYILTYIH